MQRKTFLALALAGAAGAPVAGAGLARALDEEAHPEPSLRRRPLRVPADGAIRVAFVLGPMANVIDTAGPWEVFQDAGAGSGGASPFQLLTVAEATDPLQATGGLTLVPDHTFVSAPQPNVVVVPAHQSSAATTEWLRAAAPKADLLMSVCTGAFVLAGTGLLDGRTATTHHDFYGDFEAQFPKVRLVRGRRFVEHDRVATAGGLTSGIDLALRVVERYLGRPAAASTARYMEHHSVRWRTA